jgi:GNAT superfamily N-acetyltransferase
LFIGESPPASGRFFYQRDSGLYRAIREAFQRAEPSIGDDAFLDAFQSAGCYLVDLCLDPVDRLGAQERAENCRRGEAGLATKIRQLQPPVIITVVRSIEANVRNAAGRAGWTGNMIHLPYPGRWAHLRKKFVDGLWPAIAGLMESFSIRLAREEDIAAIGQIELEAAQLLRGHAPESALAETSDTGVLRHAMRGGLLWIAESGGRPVGFAHVEILADGLPHLEEIDVLPAYGRRGIGAALVRAICQWASERGYSAITLTTFRAVPWNFPFYARLGFEELSRPDLRPTLAAVVADEAARGLDPGTRAVMQYRCVSSMVGSLDAT